MALFAEYAGSRVVAARITLPASGRVVADVSFADETAVAATGVLRVADLSLLCTVLRGAAFAGARSARLVGGYGGWNREVSALPYAKAQGVRLATVIGDAAAAVGERVNLRGAYASQLVGQRWVRSAGPASLVLSQTVQRAWWVDGDGVTQVGERPTALVSQGFDIINWQPGLGLATIATETLAVWQPGIAFRSPILPAPLTVTSVSIVMAPSGVLRLEVLTREP